MICPKCHSSFEYAIAIQVVKRRVYVDEHKGFVSYVNPDIEPGSAAEDFILIQFECPECGAVFDGLTEFRSKPTPEQLDKLKDDVIALCQKHGLWQDTCIYVNGNRYCATSYEPDKIIVEEGLDPHDYFEYAGDIFSMSFEGPLYHVFNEYTDSGEIFRADFDRLIADLGLYYEFGDAWNLSCYLEP